LKEPPPNEGQDFLFGQCRFLIRAFVFRLVNDNLESRTMLSSIESAAIFNPRLAPLRSRHMQSPATPRNLRTYTAAVLAKLREFAPYAAIELILPGGSLMALLLWLYRRHKKGAALSGCIPSQVIH
jgi:hypothetical protein